ncbi:DNA/RNA non-specific endonuclease [Lactococcus insecticola]|uniref:DNA-entry nuclease n=1 Tax=Pseudolactococcus insecticola TaxID=2709158 RepID=A0A6A0BA20_9LACT|nr:DNA/RNA non-specific endonuclease [Lactococcus insecticola]GFH40667.1 DNA-entry nuclease [Lactococcus insecticola]
MKASDEKKLIQLFKRLSTTQKIIASVVVVLAIGGYYVYQNNLAQPARQTVTSTVSQTVSGSNTTQEDLLKLKWDGSDDYYTQVNGGKSTFSDAELKQSQDKDYWVTFSALDKLGRAQVANARLSYTQYMKVKNISRPRIPNDPIGWRYQGHSNNQDIYFDNELVTLYNRSHLIAWMFTGDAGSKENLVTGTRAMNSPGMNDFEGQISDVLYYKKLHVRYQVTPIYNGNERLPRGVHMMAKSIEDGGKAYDLNVYVFNIQPGYQINYLTGQGQKK